MKKITADPATIWGLADRGLLERGLRADVVVFDPTTIDRGPEVASDDFPRGGAWEHHTVIEKGPRGGGGGGGGRGRRPPGVRRPQRQEERGGRRRHHGPNGGEAEASSNPTGEAGGPPLLRAEGPFPPSRPWRSSGPMTSRSIGWPWRSMARRGS